MRRLVFAVLLLAGVAVGVALGLVLAPERSTRRAPAFAGSSAEAKIAFGSQDGIFVVGADGSGLSRLTDGWDDDPAWSPDGRRIAFTRTRGRVQQIYVVGADGHGLRRLTSGRFNSLQPSWSPDGTKIAFEHDTTGLDGTVGIYVMDADGGHARKLVSSTELYVSPDWSPDGQRIAFQRGFDEIVVVNADGTGLRRVGRSEAHKPDWAPDGARLAFESMRFARGAARLGIYAMNADGSGRRLVRDGFAQPAWSPDGRQLAAFRVLLSGLGAIYVIDAATGHVRWLASGVDAESPDWQPIRR